MVSLSSVQQSPRRDAERLSGRRCWQLRGRRFCRFGLSYACRESLALCYRRFRGVKEEREQAMSSEQPCGTRCDLGGCLCFVMAGCSLRFGGQ